MKHSKDYQENISSKDFYGREINLRSENIALFLNEYCAISKLSIQFLRMTDILVDP